MKEFFKDSQFSFQTLRLLGETAWGAADIGEVLETIERIKDGDFESWCIEWTKTAERMDKFAKECYLDGNLISAAEGYLRASNYYRTAEFYLHENLEDKRILELYDKSLECFSFVMKLNNPVIEGIRIPYEGTSIPAHFYKVDENIPRPTIIAITGFDGTKEEMYGLGMAAVKRGINCIAIEGPGQGEVVRKQSLFFRPDYEKVITPVVDYLISRKEVDSKNIILLGESFGGYLVERAAAFEHRIAACIANTGVFDFTSSKTSPDLPKEQLIKEITENIDEVNMELRKSMEISNEMRWAFSHGMYVFGVKTPAEWLLKAQEYCIDGVYYKIKCPTLIIDCENEDLLKGQPKKIYDLLTCPKEFMMFKAEEGAGAHCQVGGKLISNQRIFNWIQKIIIANTNL